MLQRSIADEQCDSAATALRQRRTFEVLSGIGLVANARVLEQERVTDVLSSSRPPIAHGENSN